MSKACHLESCLAISLQFGPNSSCAKRIACNYLLSLSKVSFLVFRITICHSSCVKRIAFKYLFKCHPDMLDHEMPLIMFQANNLQIPQKCHPRHVGSRDVTHHVPSEQLANTFLSVISGMSDHEMSLIMCQENSLQIPFCAKRTSFKYLLFSQKYHPRYVKSRDVTHHVPSEQLANTFYFLKSIIPGMSDHEMSLIMCQANNLQTPFIFSKVTSLVCLVKRCLFHFTTYSYQYRQQVILVICQHTTTYTNSRTMSLLFYHIQLSIPIVGNTCLLSM